MFGQLSRRVSIINIELHIYFAIEGIIDECYPHTTFFNMTCNEDDETIENAHDKFDDSLGRLLHYNKDNEYNEDSVIDLSKFNSNNSIIAVVEKESEFYDKFIHIIDVISKPIYNKSISEVQKSMPELAKYYTKMTEDLKAFIDVLTTENAGKFEHDLSNRVTS